jgi:copper homeostasis protein
MAEFTLEIAAFSLAGALRAQNAGAHRVELCENPADGGTTPSYGNLVVARKQLYIPVFPIIRPRAGDFVYSDFEYEAIKQDLLNCKKIGFEGVVIGLSLENGDIDVRRTAKLVELAYPMEVTFHRAFDRCRMPMQALEDIISTGCDRILTSGQFPLAIDGVELIANLVVQASGRIQIMPGSGINSGNIQTIMEKTSASEFHASARKAVPGHMSFEVETMREKLEYFSVDENEIKAMLSVLASQPSSIS